MSRHHGWLRRLPRGRWRRVCSALSWAGCWSLLLRELDRLAYPAAEALVNGGRHPERRRKPR